MSARSFASVGYVAGIAGTALLCYLVSLQVAAERAELEKVETRIVLAQRDIRLLQTEIGTRGRLAQLERWNVKVLALSAPKAEQFLGGSFELARLTAPPPRQEVEAPVVLASAPARSPRPVLAQDSVDEAGEPAPATTPSVPKLMHVAGLKRPESADKPARPAVKPALTAKPIEQPKARPAAALLQTASLKADPTPRPVKKPVTSAAAKPKPAEPRTATAKDRTTGQ